MLKEAHDTWVQKRAYSAKVDWVPKYTEAEVGIKEFVTRCDGFGGIVKATWADFVVQEVRLRDGSLVTIPEKKQSDLQNNKLQLHGSKSVDTSSMPPEDGRRVIRLLRFVLCKMGLDTITAIRAIASACRMPYTNFRFAGIKDKYGVTTQEVTVHGVSAQKLLRFNLDHRQSGGKVLISSVERCAAPLHSGELQGNRFVIAVRNVTARDDAVAEAVRGVRRRGFVNYFGMQRFGGGSVASIAAGRALLRGDADAFAELLFSPDRASDRREIRAKARFQKDQDMRRALAALPPYCTNERLFLQYRLDGRSVAQAVGAIPYRSMYEQSFASALWNEACSLRLQAYGARPARGDIVLLSTSGGGANGKKAQVVKVLSKQDVKSRAYSIRDVVLPMLTPTRKVLLPRNKVGRWLQKRIEEEGLGDMVEVLPHGESEDAEGSGVAFRGIPVETPQSGEAAGDRGEGEGDGGGDGGGDLGLKSEGEGGGGKERGKQQREGGGSRVVEDREGEGLGAGGVEEVVGLCKLRPIVVRPQGFKWCLRRYQRADDQLFEGDEAKMRDGGAGPHKGIVVAFTLEAGCYATMLLRELMRVDSSWSAHHQKMRDLVTAGCSEAERKKAQKRRRRTQSLLRAKRRKAVEQRRAIDEAVKELPLRSFVAK